MTKKRAKKTDSTTESKHSHKKTKSKKDNFELEKTLTHNLVELQKVHTDLAEKFDKLAKEISNILALFELTARNFAKNAPIGEYEKDKDFLQKIDTLLDQNKTLAKGLTLVEERLRERMYGASPEPRQEQKQPAQKPAQQKPNEEEFQPSMLSGNRPLPRF